MISPHTPPGTKIVCIDDQYHTNYNAPYNVGAGDMDGLTKGHVYTVQAIERDDYVKDGFAVVLVEIRRKLAGRDWGHGFALMRFRYVDLPKILREIELGGKPDPNSWEEPKRKKTRARPKETVGGPEGW
jgi:hypothetical protein